VTGGGSGALAAVLADDAELAGDAKARIAMIDSGVK